MTKQEQISEMAKIIDDRLIEARGYLGSMNKGKGYWIAQKLIEHYQPKLPEDSVVLSREECDNKVILDEDHFLRVLDNERAQARKETVKEVTGKLKNYFEDKLVDEFGNITTDINEIKGCIDELLKEYEK